MPQTLDTLASRAIACTVHRRRLGAPDVETSAALALPLLESVGVAVFSLVCLKDTKNLLHILPNQTDFHFPFGNTDCGCGATLPR